MKKKAFQILLYGNLLILFPSILNELVRYNIINYKYAWSIMSLNWFVINAIYGLLFSIPAMILISISTLIVIEKEHKKGNMILFIWLIFWLFWFLISFIDIEIPYKVFVLIPIIVMIGVGINTLIIIIKEHKKENIIKQNLFIWLVLWLLNAIAILSSFDMAMFVARQ